MDRAYRFLVLSFLLFGLLLLLSGAMIFARKIGFGAEAISAYYLGSTAAFTEPKSPVGVLKIILGHLFAFGLFWFVVLHFLRFTRFYERALWLIAALFCVSMLELFAPFLILQFGALFAYVKLAALFGYYALMLYAFWLLLRSIISKEDS